LRIAIALIRTSGFQCTHQPGELAEPAFRPGPAGRQDFGLQHDLGIGDVRHVNGGAGRELHGLAAQTAGNPHLIDAERRPEARAGDLERVRTDGNGNRQRLAALQRPLREQPHVVRRHDVDAGKVLFLDDEAVDARVESKLRVFADHHAGGDHRAAVIDRRHRDRQLEQIDLVADHRHLAGRRAVDVFRRDRLRDRGGELVLDLAEILAAHRHGGAFFGADDAGHHRHVVADHIMEIECGLGLVDQRRDVADIDRLMQVHKLTRLPQPVQKLAEILFHFKALQLFGRAGRGQEPSPLRT
jgi:hypothetical protein